MGHRTVLTPDTEFEDTVGGLYTQLRDMASAFAFKPGERINESALSRKLGASRTPLREALNRLVAEGFMDFRSGQGFFCRDLSPERILHLYEARMAIECEATRQAARRSNADALADLAAFLADTAEEYASSQDAAHLLHLDETFHIRLCRQADNPELTRMLENVYDRIRFVRLADLKRLQLAGRTTTAHHRAILDAVSGGNAEAAAAAMRQHIEGRYRHVTEAVRLAFADIYAPIEES